MTCWIQLCGTQRRRNLHGFFGFWLAWPVPTCCVLDGNEYHPSYHPSRVRFAWISWRWRTEWQFVRVASRWASIWTCHDQHSQDQDAHHAEVLLNTLVEFYTCLLCIWVWDFCCAVRAPFRSWMFYPKNICKKYNTHHHHPEKKENKQNMSFKTHINTHILPIASLRSICVSSRPWGRMDRRMA